LNQPTNPNTSLDRIDAVRHHHHVVGRHALGDQDLLHRCRNDERASRAAADPALETIGQAAQNEPLVLFLLVRQGGVDLEHDGDVQQLGDQHAADVEQRVALVEERRPPAAHRAPKRPDAPEVVAQLGALVHQCQIPQPPEDAIAFTAARRRDVRARGCGLRLCRTLAIGEAHELGRVPQGAEGREDLLDMDPLGVLPGGAMVIQDVHRAPLHFAQCFAHFSRAKRIHSL
jgi:hypothetical protein